MVVLGGGAVSYERGTPVGAHAERGGQHSLRLRPPHPRHLGTPHPTPYTLISHKVFLKLFYKSQFPHKSVNLFLILVKVQDL